MNTLHVNLGERSYPIHIACGLIDQAGRWIRERLGACAVAVVTDDNVAVDLSLGVLVGACVKSDAKVCDTAAVYDKFCVAVYAV